MTGRNLDGKEDRPDTYRGRADEGKSGRNLKEYESV